MFSRIYFFIKLYSNSKNKGFSLVASGQFDIIVVLKEEILETEGNMLVLKIE